MSPGNTRSEKLRKSIQASIDHAEAERKRELWLKRLELARSGVMAYHRKQIPEAVKAFQQYLRILEDGKGIGEGALNPSQFDRKTDLHELLLINGIYWDLAKLFDRTQSPERQREFRTYLQKFILFSKGMPFEMVAAETLRKYISNEKPVHKQVFKDAYKQLVGSNCFVATALLDVTQEQTQPELRRFRDQVLARTQAGRLFIRAYYAIGPQLAAATEKFPQPARKILGRALDSVARATQYLP